MRTGCGSCGSAPGSEPASGSLHGRVGGRPYRVSHVPPPRRRAPGPQPERPAPRLAVRVRARARARRRVGSPRPHRRDRRLMLERLKELGDAHERQELLRLSAAYPGRVRQFPRPAYDLGSLTAAHETTIATLRGDDTDVVFQATFFDGGLVGHADFLERTADGWLVCDTKLARTRPSRRCSRSLRMPPSCVPLAFRLLPWPGSSGQRADDRPPARRHPPGLRRTTGPSRGRARRAPRRGRAGWLGRPALARLRPLRGVRGRGRGGARRAARRGGPSAAASPPARGRRHDDRRARGAHRARARRARVDAGSVARAGAPPARPGVRPRGPGRVRGRHRCGAAGDARPERRRHLLRLRGRPPVAERGSDDWGLEYLFGMVEVDGVDGRRRSRASAPSGPTTARRRSRRSSTSSPTPRAAPAVAGPARLPLRALREERAAPRSPPATACARTTSTSSCATGSSSTCMPWCARPSASRSAPTRIKKLEPLYMGPAHRGVAKGDDSIVGLPPVRAATREMDDVETARRRDRRTSPTTTRTTASRPCSCATGSSHGRPSRRP